MTIKGLGKFGVWAHPVQPVLFSAEGAREVENLGYGTLWLGGSPEAGLTVVEPLLEATESLIVGTSIVNIWSAPAREVAESFHRIDKRFPGRFVLGIGAGHPEVTDVYRKPYDALVEYLDVLDDAGVPKERRALAALGPRVLKLARDRTAGALPYLTTAEHTRQAREILGPDALLVAEHKVVVDTDPVRARATARPKVEHYLKLQNYTANLKRLGFADEDIEFPGSDRLIDALALHGTADQVADSLVAHLAAGADQVAVQAAADDFLPTLRELAPALAERV
ncbi:LLM class F420-dependent oxidoreductase [Nocardia sp. CDC159]|uniref:LLM class F420-dependent oxidoreductase n=1 Tax=Nocardia pulmonis TaxID=2951408 RepID=A0A9X2E992_9NOCA|nr:MULTISPECIES: LLM class F420-dependent oxidoreductase [Nocardia]MCM6776119.1 LLM class F420-dependent oxidoreductase [Nocardia pulmonis]MCM6788554.1 LLM class F420-dependent oxidoreductase [Nocardia sp. CDC159]